MTINLSNNNPRVNYTATSGQTAFTIPFDYFDDGDISVYQNGTLKTITTHYTISGSTMTLVTGATVGDKIAITRDVPLERTTDLTSTYSAASINSQLDTIVAQIADLDDRVSRSISLNDYEVGVSLDLPATADRLGKTIQFNSSTGALEVGPSGDELTSLASITSDITTVAGVASDLSTVATAASNINAVGLNISKVSTVSSNISTILSVNSNISDIRSVADSITDINDIADSIDQVELVAGSISNVDTVALANSNISTVAGDINNINTVAGLSANITTVAGITGAISTVNSNAADITSVSNNIDDVNDVANVITKVTTVADNISNVNTLSSQASNIGTLAGISGSINSLGGISSDITTLAAVASEIGDAATNAASALSAKTAAESARDATLAAFDSFDDRYLGAKTADPSVDNDGNALVGGALYYNTTDEVMKVYTGSVWVAAYASLSGALLVDSNLSDLNNVASARTNLGLGTAATTASTDYVAVTGDSMTGNLSFGDNDKAIFGAGSDLQIYHDGDDSYISDQGTGDLKIQGANVRLENPSGVRYFQGSSGVSYLYNAGDIKLNTTSTGVDVTGTVTADGLTVQADVSDIIVESTNAAGEAWKLRSTYNNTGGSYGAFQIRDEANNIWMRFNQNNGSDEIDLRTTNLDRFNIANNGDISFYENTGTTAKLTWDSSAEGLWLQGYGTSTTPAGTPSAINDAGLYFANNSGNARWALLPEESAGEDTLNLFSDVSNVWTPVISFSRTTQQVGIGTSSPSYLVDAQTSSGNAQMQIKSGSDLAQLILTSTDTTGSSQINFADADSTNVGMLQYFHSDNHMEFTVNSAEAMRIDSSGNVGIGTSSPSDDLHIASSLATIRLEDSDVAGGASYALITSSSNGNIQFSADPDNVRSSSDIRFNVDGSEAMRIDSSGNLLVGKTAVDSTVAGVAARGVGDLYLTRSGSVPLILNRLSNDGELIQFRKSSATVGSIGNVGNNLYYSGGSNLTYSTGLLMKGASASNTRVIVPADDSGTELDAKVSLGRDVSRFKDLYLSGGVYLGGTGAANKLDDYEEGTWTPTISSGTISAADARYVKIGSQVTVSAIINDISDNTTSADIVIGGFPYTSSSSNRSVGSVMFRYFTKTNAAQMTTYLGGNTTQMALYWSFETNANWQPVEYQDGAQANMDIIFTFTYRV